PPLSLSLRVALTRVSAKDSPPRGVAVPAPPRRGSLVQQAATAVAESGGLVKSIIKRPVDAKETPKKGDMVVMHYVASLSDGTVFDSSRYRKERFQFVLGESEVIDGWDILVGTMALGEIAQFRIPPDYAYGEAGAKYGDEVIVPPNETLTFEVELLDIGTPKEEEQVEEEPEPESDEKTWFWEKDPERESGKGIGWAWQATGSGKEICVSVPIPKDTTVKQIKVDIRTFSLLCKIGSQVFIDSKISQDVDMDDSYWVVDVKDDKPYLLIYLAKLNKEVRWESLLLGGDPVDAPAPKAVEADVVDVDAALRAANATTRSSPGIIDAS
ncbi:unnamed protein product, partial [Prorocentrum cordatum]